MDGVIVNFSDRLAKEFGLEEWPSPSSYKLSEVLNVGWSDIQKKLTREFYANLKPTEEAFELLDVIYKYFDKENVLLLTNPVINDTAETIAGKFDWLNKYMPEFVKENRFIFTKTKSAVAARNKLLIDDYHKNIKLFEENGGIGILYPNPWNRNFVISDTDKKLKFVDDEIKVFISGLLK